MLVCSDVMARGMDLENVDYVLLYDSVSYLNSYIHKVGRTARAGRPGTAISFLEHKEIFFFKKMMSQIKSKATGMENPQTKSHKVIINPLLIITRHLYLGKSCLNLLPDVFRYMA